VTVMPSATSVSLLPDTFCLVPVVASAEGHDGDSRLYSAITGADLLRGLPMLQGSVRLDPRLSVVADCLHPGTAGDALITKPEWSRVFRDLPSGMSMILPWPCSETGL